MGTEPDTGAASLTDGSTSSRPDAESTSDAQVSSTDSGSDAATDGGADPGADADAATACTPSGVGMANPQPCDPSFAFNLPCCSGTCNVGIAASACGCFPDTDGTTGSGFACTSNAQCCSGMCGPNKICGCIKTGTFADDPTLCCSGNATPGGLCD